jgi:hypothetical protein
MVALPSFLASHTCKRLKLQAEGVNGSLMEVLNAR